MRGDEPDNRASIDEIVEVFPTCVGMNRLRTHNFLLPRCVPHMRGDEPDNRASIDEIVEVFPTCVGMNRCASRTGRPPGRVPHMRGDEPTPAGLALRQMTCSPHAWG